MVKECATILDCTCGNRSMYVLKESSNILYIDIEKDLTIKPDLLMDIRKTDFNDERFKIIIFDPPFEWNRIKNNSVFNTPSYKDYIDKWEKDIRKSPPRYYGNDKYKSRKELIRFIIDAEKEIYRILDNRGLLFLKWSEIRIKRLNILGIFNKWNRLIDIPIRHKAENAKGTYWFIMQKKEIEK